MLGNRINSNKKKQFINNKKTKKKLNEFDTNFFNDFRVTEHSHLHKYTITRITR